MPKKCVTKTKLNPIITPLLIRDWKLNISLVYISISYFAVPKNLRIVFANYFTLKDNSDDGKFNSN